MKFSHSPYLNHLGIKNFFLRLLISTFKANCCIDVKYLFRFDKKFQKEKKQCTGLSVEF